MTPNIPPFTPPRHGSHRFHCPHCGTYSSHGWCTPNRNCVYENFTTNHGTDENFKISMCSSCQNIAVWIPNDDLPAEIKVDYVEAQNILARSPRGAAALLRLAIQKMCKHLGEDGENINADIAELVKKGLPEMIQQALDSRAFIALFPPRAVPQRADAGR